jgi:SAM-dependent methyltransferase
MPQDSSKQEFWETRYRTGTTPWDAGRVPPMLSDFLAREAPGTVLIPGCGSGYEVRAFGEAGWQVSAVDFSAAAIERARRNAGRWADQVMFADFFNFVPEPADISLIYERTFLCALPRAHWLDYTSRVTFLLPKGARLAGFFFFSDNDRGPPFGLWPGEQHALLGETFELLEERTVPPEQSVEVLAGREKWQVWMRR